MKKIAISLGDINGIGIELVLRNHNKISKLCKPIYCIDKKLLKQASKLLNLKIPNETVKRIDIDFLASSLELEKVFL